jgi:hypothetical protein
METNSSYFKSQDGRVKYNLSENKSKNKQTQPTWKQERQKQDKRDRWNY